MVAQGQNRTLADAAMYIVESSYICFYNYFDLFQRPPFTNIPEWVVNAPENAIQLHTSSYGILHRIQREQAMENLGLILTFAGSIIAAIISAIVAVKTLRKQETTEAEQRELDQYKVDAEDTIRKSDAAHRLSSSAVLIVEKYEVQAARLEREIDELKLEIKNMKEDRDKRYSDMMLELTITQLQLKNALGVIAMWVEYATEHNLPIIAIPSTREQIEANLK